MNAEAQRMIHVVAFTVASEGISFEDWCHFSSGAQRLGHCIRENTECVLEASKKNMRTGSIQELDRC